MGTVVGSWRLSLLIFLFIFVTSCYSVYGFFGDLDTAQEINSERLNASYNRSAWSGGVDYNSTDIGTEKADDFISVMGNIGTFLSFGDIDNEWAKIPLQITITICWITIGYIIYTFIKEWIPLT